MKANTKALLLILFLPGPFAEILSTNLPWTKFLNPFAFFGVVLVYGIGCLLIWEASVRWKTQWSIIFPAIAYGIYEEGLVTRAFFNPNWFSSGPLAGNWMIFGVQWGWTIILLVFHAIISTLIPIYIVSTLYPECRGKPLIGKKGFIWTLLGIIAALVIGANVFSKKEGIEFIPNPILLVSSFVAIILLVLLGYYFRSHRIEFRRWLLHPIFVATAALFIQFANCAFPNILALKGVLDQEAIAFQSLLVLGYAFVSATQLLNEGTETKHKVAFTFGSVLFWLALSIIMGFKGRTDLLESAPVIFVLLIIWSYRVLKTSSTKISTTSTDS